MAALRLLSVLVITLLVLSDFAAARGAEAYPDPRGVIFVGLVLGELALVATWCACAKRSWPRSARRVGAPGCDSCLFTRR